MTTLAAIETNYAGCRFRSRLEARWAVFFDHLKVEWEYETQGYTIGPERKPYLPDFWLPTLGRWVEVKGQFEHEGLQTAIWAASGAGLPIYPTDTQPCPPDALFPRRERLLILGQVPKPSMGARLHWRLDVVASDIVVAQPFMFLPLHGRLETLEVFAPLTMNQYVAGENAPAGFLSRLVDGMASPLLNQPHAITEAYRAARSARFEHGESGAP